MNAATIQTAIEQRLAAVSGLTATPGALDMSVNAKDLPVAWAVFEGYETSEEWTQSADVAARWRVPVVFSYNRDTFPAEIVSVIPAIHAAFRDGIDGCGRVTVEDGGEPEALGEAAASFLVRKILFVRVEFEE